MKNLRKALAILLSTALTFGLNGISAFAEIGPGDDEPAAAVVAENEENTAGTAELPAESPLREDTGTVAEPAEVAADPESSAAISDNNEEEGPDLKTEEDGTESAPEENAEVFSDSSASSEEASDGEDTGKEGDKKGEDDEPTETPTPTPEPTKSSYFYNDGNISVIATISDPAAVPDEARFVVTQVTPESAGYNYDAYMQALNDHAEEGKEYTQENTLLYDMAFMVAKTDEEGNAIEGQMAEYQPAEGTVKISAVFKQEQLRQELGAETAADVEVTHLPLSDAVMENVDKTADATAISAGDVLVEDLAATASIDGMDTVEFTTDGFSVFGFKNGAGQRNTWAGTSDYTIGDVYSGLGEAVDYAIFANTYIHGSHLEGNVKVGELIIQKGEQLNQISNVLTRNDIESIVITKVVDPAVGKDTTFRFAFYEGDEETSPRYGSSYSIKIPAGQTSGQITLDNHNAANIIDRLKTMDLWLKEWDNTQKELDAGDSFKDKTEGKTYTVSYISESGNVVDGNHIKSSIKTEMFNNYIGKIRMDCGSVQQHFFDGTTTAHTYIESMSSIGWSGNDLVFNSENQVRVTDYKNIDSGASNNNIPSRITQQGGITADINSQMASLRTFSSNLANAKNGAKAGSGSLSVINLKSTTGTFSGDMNNANFNEPQNGHAVSETLNENSFLLINVDCTGFSSYKIDSKFVIDGQDPDGTNEELGRHIIWNFVQQGGNGFVPYTGTITPSAVTGGLILAPSATVKQQDGLRGTVIANVFDRSGGTETHKDSITTATKVEITVQNTAQQETSLSGQKTWAGEPAGFNTANRPTVTIHLLANGVDTGQTQTPDAVTGAYKFEELPAKEGSGNTISYTVSETMTGDLAKNYTSEQNGNNFVNTYQTKELSGQKTWAGEPANFNTANRPSVTITLYKGSGDDAVSTGLTKTPDAATGAYSFTGLQKYDASGNEIIYSVKETMTGDLAKNYASEQNGNDFINTYQTTEIGGRKTWANEPASYDTANRPTVTITLYKGSGSNAVSTGLTTTPEATTGAYSFTGLQKYDASGSEIVYTVKETMSGGLAANYVPTQNDRNFINTFQTVSLAGRKTWAGEPANYDTAKRPAVTIHLLADGVDTGQTATPNATTGVYQFTGLQKYNADGSLINYTVTETMTGGNAAYYTGSVSGSNVVNTYDETSLSGTKTWAGEPSGFNTANRPVVTITLYQGEGENRVSTGKTATPDPETGAYSFTGLLKKDASGNEIVYSVEETVTGDLAKNYTSEQDGNNFINTYQTTEISGRKTWGGEPADFDPADRPSVTITLYKGSGAGAISTGLTKTPDAETGAYSFTGLQKYDAAGNEIVYSVRETMTGDLAANYVGSQSGKNFVNSYQKVSVEGRKTWAGEPANYDTGKRPTVTIHLLAGGTDTGKTATPDATTGAYRFTDLQKYDAEGNAIVYTITETTEGGSAAYYTPSYNGNDVVNTYSDTSLSGTKTWAGEPANFNTANRPAVTITLYQGEGENRVSTGLTTTPDPETGAYSFTGLLKKDASGNEIIYSVEETMTGSLAKNYTSEQTGNNFVNTYQTTELSGIKTWAGEPANFNTANRPAVTITLYKGSGTDAVSTGLTRTPDAITGAYSFTDLQKYDADGNLIVYAVKETVTGDLAKNYVSQQTGNNFINTYQKTSVSGRKTWAGEPANYDTSKRPAVTIHLLAGGVDTGKTARPNATTGAYSFTDLQKYDADGDAIVYTITEATEGGSAAYYTPSYSGNDVVNTYDDTSLSGTKTWAGEPANFNTANRPTVTITLYQGEGENRVSTGKTTTPDPETGAYSFTGLLKKDAAGNEIVYSVEETVTGDLAKNYASEQNGNNFINTYQTTELSGTKTWAGEPANFNIANRPSVTITLYKGSGANAVSTGLTTTPDATTGAYSFADLQKYDSAGELIVYTVKESVSGDLAANYAQDQSGNNFINTYQTTSLSGRKTWAGEPANYDTSKRPTVTIHLLAGGSDTGKTATPNVTTGAYSFTDLQKYDADGNAIVYSINETTEGGNGAYYTPSYSCSDVVNTYDDTSLSGTKTWAGEPASFNTANRPTVTITLYQGEGENKVSTGKTTTPDPETGAYSFTGLLKKDASGNEIVYSVEETMTGDLAKNYTSEQTGNNFINTYQTTELSGTKTWKGEPASFNTANRPTVTITLFIGTGEGASSTGLTTTPDATTGAYSFTNLQKYDSSGNEIVYSVKESVTGDLAANYTQEQDGSNFINTYQKTSLEGTKTWNGEPAEYDISKRPAVTVHLMADNVDTGKTATPVASTGKYGFSDLQKYASDGHEIAYSVTETTEGGNAAYYTGSVSGSNLINTYDETSLSGIKTWAGEPANFDTANRPTVTITLYQGEGENRVSTGKTTTPDATSGAYSFTGLLKTDADGNTIVYSVEETMTGELAKNYVSEQNDNNFINTYQTTELSGIKTWAGEPANYDTSKRPTVTITLYKGSGANTTSTGLSTTPDATTGAYSFTDLQKYDSTGNLIVYTVKESVSGDLASNYAQEQSGSNFINTYQTTSLSGRKTWAGEPANYDTSKRPTVIIHLLAGGVDTGKTATPDASTGAYSFTDLQKYAADGSEIAYTINETTEGGNAAYYTPGYSGNDVVNAYDDTSLSGTKTWAGEPADFNTAKRPTVTITLYQGEGENKVSTGKTTAPDPTTGAYSFTGLLKKDADGNTIVYSVEETMTGDLTANYIASQSGNNFVNTYQTTEIAGIKTWTNEHPNFNTTNRPTVTIHLYANGTDTGLTTSPDANGNYGFTGLQKYDANGTAITYSLTETMSGTYTNHYTSGQSGNNFINDYTYEASGDITLTGTKSYEGGELAKGLFTFSVKENGTEVATGSVEETGVITFTKISYESEDAVGTHTYQITENIPDDATEENGYISPSDNIKYDPTVRTVTVTVTDDDEGTLVAELTDDSDEITFANENRSKDGSLAVTKTVEKKGNVDAEYSGSFYVGISETQNPEQIAEADVKKVDVASGTGTVIYTSLEVGHTYYVYEVTEDGKPIENGEAYPFTIEGQGGTARITRTNLHQAVSITNHEKLTKAAIVKVWNDEQNKKHVRPTELKVVLSRTAGRGEAEKVQEVTLQPNETDAKNQAVQWPMITIEDLPAFNMAGEKYTYSWTEDTEGLPTGYVLDDDNPATTATVNGTEVTTITNRYEDVMAEVVARFNKLDEDGQPLAGAQLQILDADGEIAYSYRLDADTHSMIPDEQCEWTSAGDDQGKVYTLLDDTDNSDDEGTHYFLHEVASPDENSYLVADDIEFMVMTKVLDGAEVTKLYTFDEDGNAVEVTGNSLTITMTDKRAHKVTISKQDIAGKAIAGAELKIVDADGKDVTDCLTAEGLSWTTKAGENKTVSLLTGSYKLTEITPPGGYKEAADIDFTVDIDGMVTVDEEDVDGLVVMTDRYDSHEIAINKVDIAGKQIAGATLKITGTTLSGTAQTFTAATTDSAMKIRIYPGSYTLTEVQAPDGYVYAADIDFKVEVDGSITIGGETTKNGDVKNDKTAEITMTDEYNETRFQKLAEDTKKDLKGATLKITDADGNTVLDASGQAVDPWTTDGSVKTIKGLKDGTYQLVETKAPDGYAIADPITFQLKEGKLTIAGKDADCVVMTDKRAAVNPNKTPTTTPTYGVKTGDSGSAIIWADMMGIAAIALGELLRRKRRNRK